MILTFETLTKDRDELLRMLECGYGLRIFEENELPHAARNCFHPAQWKWQRNWSQKPGVHADSRNRLHVFCYVDQRPFFLFQHARCAPLHLASSETWRTIPEGALKAEALKLYEMLKEESGNFRNFRFVLRELAHAIHILNLLYNSSLSFAKFSK